MVTIPPPRVRTHRMAIGDPDQRGLSVGKIRCGSCISNNHENCVVNIEMGKGMSAYLWRCECICHAGESSCVLCGRRDLPTDAGRCVDLRSCAAARAHGTSFRERIAL